MNYFAWVGLRDLNDLYGLQGLHIVDVSLLFFAVKSVWSL